MKYVSRHDGRQHEIPSEEIGRFPEESTTGPCAQAVSLVKNWPPKVRRRAVALAVRCETCTSTLVNVYRTPQGHLVWPAGGRLDAYSRGAHVRTEDPRGTSHAEPILAEEAFDSPSRLVVRCGKCAHSDPWQLDSRFLLMLLRGGSVRELRVDDPRLHGRRFRNIVRRAASMTLN